MWSSALTSIVKFQSLAQFPIDLFSHPVMPTFVFLLCQFAAFTFVINCFSLSPHNLYLQFYCVLSIFSLIYRVFHNYWYKIAASKRTWLRKDNHKRETECLVVSAQNHATGLMSRMFDKGPGDRGSNPCRVIPKTQKWYLMPPCLALSTIK